MIRKALKITLYVIGSILLLLLGAIVYINSPWGQNFVRGRAEAYLNNKLKTTVHIGHLGYGLPKYIVINDALFLDQAKDTLLSVGTLKIDLNMLQLFHKKADIQQIVLQGVHSHLYRNAPDTIFNFSYILTAFTSNTIKDTAKATASSLAFNLDKVRLDDIHARFDDYTGGMQFAINLDHLELKMEKMDLDNMLFHLRGLSVSGLQTIFDQDTSYLPPTPKDTTKSRLKIIADNVDLQNIGFKYNNNLNKFLFALQLGGLQLQLNQYNRDNNLVDVKKLVVNNSAATLTIGRSTTPPAPVDSIVKIDTTEGWDVRAKQVDLSGLNFKMDDENTPSLPSGFDYSHLDIHNLALNLRNLLYSNGVSGNILHMAVIDKSGLDLKELKTEFNYNSSGVVLKGLYLQTPNTIIQNYLEFHYPSVYAVQKNMQQLQIKVNVEKSIIGLHDVALFVPQLKKQPLFHKYENGHLRLEAAANGFLNNLNIAHFYALGLDNTEILLNGRLGGIPDPKKLSYNLHITKFNSSRNDITALLPPNTLPASFRLPDRFGAVGQLAGNTKDFNTDLVLASTDGSAYVKGLIATSPGKGREKYDLTIKTMQLNVGHILKQDSLFGPISANMDINGQSFDTKTMNATADGTISSAFIKGYRYHDVTFDGKVAAQRGAINMRSADPNLQVQLNATADFSGKYAAAIADIRIDSIDFQALKLYSTELRARGTIHADFPELNPDYPRGSFTWYQPVIVAEGKRYFMDSVYAISRPSADTGQNIFVGLGILDARLTGKTPLTKIGAIVQDHISRHYTTAGIDSLKADLAKFTTKNNKASAASKTVAVKPQPKKDTTTIPADYNLNLVARVYDKPLLHGLYPSLTSFDSIHVDASLTPRNLTFNVNAPEIVYGAYTIENASVQVRGSDSALAYKINADQVSQSNFALYYADIHGALDRNIITADVSLSDAGKTERFALKTSMQTIGDSQIIQLQPGLKLNYDVWEVAQPNRIVFTSKGFYVQNFEISNKGQFIKASNIQPRPLSPLKIDVSNFLLANLTNIASKNDTIPANGILSGNITVEQMSPSTKMTGDLQIQNLSVYGDTLGNLHAQVDNKTDNELNTKITLNGYGNDIALTGIYSLNAGNNALNFNVAVNALAVRTFEGIAMHQISNSSGYLRGNLKVQGTITSPAITGELRTDNLKTTVVALNTDFRMPAERIEFNNDKVAFNNFTLQDSAGNKAQITGTIGIADLTDPDLDLNVTADNWRAIHNTAKQNKELYGDLILSTKLKITGTATVPSVDGNLFILKGTKLTVGNPQSDPGLQSTKGIVVFVNMRDTSWGKALMPHRTDTVKTKHKLAAGSDINVNITIDKNAEFSLIIDEASGDFINARGDAYLNTSVSPGGVFNVTGSYMLHSGMYQMNYNFIKRRFLIQDGSTITFAGDPLKNTNLDVSAIYLANTPAYDLVMRQVPDPVQLNYYKQSLPFNVDLHMKGNLMQPSFAFDVVLPEDKIYPLAADQIELIQAKLNQVRQDTGELNKQVFAVLILGRFVSDDPFSSAAAQSVGFSAVQSVSTFIGEQLNSAASKLVKGVDLTVDLPTTEDYTTGTMRQRTDLNVAASKRVLNDRLKLTVGNDFEVEGPQPNNSSQSSLPSNLAADYMLSSDGRYTVRVYRSNYNEGPLEGYVTETGVNFIISVDYNRFKTIFMRSKSIKQRAKKTIDQ
jgi:translocation and assembly module TamB